MKKRISLILAAILIIISLSPAAPAAPPKEVSAHTLDPKTQQIIDNNKFLSSAEGSFYRVSAFQLVQALFNCNYDYIKKNLIDQKNFDKCYSTKTDMSKIRCMFDEIIKYDKKNKCVHGQYIIARSKGDAFRYIEFYMKLVKGKWKIVKYWLDA